MANSEPKMDYAEIYTASDTLDASSIFHTIYDVVGFVLYMHQQIPSYVFSLHFKTPNNFFFYLLKNRKHVEIFFSSISIASVDRIQFMQHGAGYGRRI